VRRSPPNSTHSARCLRPADKDFAWGSEGDGAGSGDNFPQSRAELYFTGNMKPGDYCRFALRLTTRPARLTIESYLEQKISSGYGKERARNCALFFFNHLTDFSSLPQVRLQVLFSDIKPFSRVESYSGFNSEGRFYIPD
jgi:hypothetical protein